jgi:hypothetical protein
MMLYVFALSRGAASQKMQEGELKAMLVWGGCSKTAFLRTPPKLIIGDKLNSRQKFDECTARRRPPLGHLACIGAGSSMLSSPITVKPGGALPQKGVSVGLGDALVSLYEGGRMYVPKKNRHALGTMPLGVENSSTTVPRMPT